MFAILSLIVHQACFRHEYAFVSVFAKVFQIETDCSNLFKVTFALIFTEYQKFVSLIFGFPEEKNNLHTAHPVL